MTSKKVGRGLTEKWPGDSGNKYLADLGKISRGKCYHPALLLRLAQQEQAIEGAAKLEGARSLQALRLQQQPATQLQEYICKLTGEAIAFDTSPGKVFLRGGNMTAWDVTAVLLGGS